MTRTLRLTRLSEKSYIFKYIAKINLHFEKISIYEEVVLWLDLSQYPMLKH
jgi:hypothetical protein